MFKKLAIGCLLLIALVVGLGLFGISQLPSEINIVSSREVAAPSEDIHAHIEDFKLWPEWSFWHIADPDAVYTYSGSESGEGAIVNWVGKEAPGSMTCTASDPMKGFWYDLTLGGPEAGMDAKCAVTYEKKGDGTLVTFEMRGDLEGTLAKFMSLAMAPGVEAAFHASLSNLNGLVTKD